MIRPRQISISVISALLILLFSYAAINKILDYHKFSGQLKSSPLVRPVAEILTWLIPSAELYAIVLLLVRDWRRNGMMLSAVLMALFTIYISLMLIFSKKLPCSCGGVIDQLTWTQHLIFNFVFLALAATGFILQKSEDLFAIEQEKPKT